MTARVEPQNGAKLEEHEIIYILETAKPILAKIRDWCLVDMPPIRLGNGMATPASITFKYSPSTGKCSNFQLNLNRLSLTPEAKTMLKESLAHELAHVAAMKWQGYKESGHGFYWGFFMILLGQKPHRFFTAKASAELHEAKRISERPQFKMLMCSNCKSPVLAELLESHYVCPSCSSSSLTEY